MTVYLARRLAALPLTLLSISVVTFALLRMIPGDPARIMLGEHATAEQTARLRAAQGLEQPIPIQYARYLSGLIQGDWGRSIKSNLPVTAELARRLPATLELGLGAMLIACAVGIPVGLLAAQRRDSWFDLLTGTGALIGVSIPLFWLGLLLGHLFGGRLGWLPPSGRTSAAVDAAVLAVLADRLRHLLLPALTLSTVPLAAIVHVTRACTLEALAQDYVRTARAKGLPGGRVLLIHAFRNGLLPLLTVIGLQTGVLLSGAVLTETIFAWPGLGQYIVDRVLARDYPAVQGVVLVTTMLFVAVNLLTDIACAGLDPRIRYD